ncbi:hypothetical protein SAMN05421821_102554 [Mucilaginibacter lappiensis]|uniref:PsbP C-terminal domain-containing protein n=1 Tax=Mucilaginibacter lappiensis TaxID=354630 RepID=A0ABR6PG33_9SPHI|nr:hypothetical protein [Mucilaginibacter lappiensis]MBB6108209.1 hypothetical protein [Mucilaginibacter lappiensis]SIQ47424.1 hypothetical protein SAMN05421821_102554 [Mucilaginibacter lappiensis]
MIKNLVAATALILLSSFVAPLPADVKNYFNIAEEQSFDNLHYKLSWSSHPAENYYKQEYLPAGETSEHFDHMLVMDFAITEATVSQLIQQKKVELEKQKPSDPIINYELYEKAGELMLDFILSDSSSGSLNIVEHNIYRYRSYTDKAGHKGVLLIGISERAYGKNIKAFLTALKGTRIKQLNKFAGYKIPDIEIKP